MSDNGWTQDRIELIKRSICPKGISDDEFALFIEQCKRSGLDPLLKEAFCVPRRVNSGNKERPNWVTKHEFQPSETGLLARAERMPDYLGVQASAVYAEDEILIDQGAGEVTHRFNPAQRKGALVGAWARVFRREKKPVVIWLDFAAYSQSTPLWGKMPATMIEKCSRVAGLRKAYPAEFGGLYIAGERPDDVDNGEDVEAETPAVKEKPALPSPGPRETLTFSTAPEKVEARVGIRESVVVEAAREPGSDDGETDALAKEGAELVATCERATKPDEVHALRPRALALPSGSPERAAVGMAMKTALDRTKRGAA